VVGEVGLSKGALTQCALPRMAEATVLKATSSNYSLVARAAARDVLQSANLKGRMVIDHSPLARGFLSGKRQIR